MVAVGTMCRIIKTKSETLSFILRVQYINEVWMKTQGTNVPSLDKEEITPPPQRQQPQASKESS